MLRFSGSINSMEENLLVGETWSVCPLCMKQIPARRIRRENKIFLEKSCPEHGSFETIIWRGYEDFDGWISGIQEPKDEPHGCPDSCGLCVSHLQETCCLILNVTNRCDLDCRFCFAGSSHEYSDPDFGFIRNSLKKMLEKGRLLIQLSGGEPTLRGDLPEIIRAAREAGAKYVQLNSNGIRLGQDRNYVKDLAEAGLSFVFMQFDGIDDGINQKIRNRKLFEIKQQAIDHCAEFNIGVTLVPTLVRGVNSHHIGELIRYAVSQSPKVRGLHFQPVTYLGRTPGIASEEDRLTLDELVHEISKQSEGMINPANLLPSACDHPLCGFHGDFVVDHNKLIPLLTRGNAPKQCCCGPSAADKNREFVARRWQRPDRIKSGDDIPEGDIHDMDVFLRRVQTHGFTITAMAFQDAMNLDLARLRNCSLHVFNDGRTIPFCSYYLTPWNQK